LAVSPSDYEWLEADRVYADRLAKTQIAFNATLRLI
jgi:hypothetical protein